MADGLCLPTKDELSEAYLNAIKKHKNFKYSKDQIAIMRQEKAKHRNAKNLANPHKEKLRVSTIISGLDEDHEDRRKWMMYLNDINKEIERRKSANSRAIALIRPCDCGDSARCFNAKY